ncbi:MAG: phosphotransferase [Methylococcaceae bacterium]|nr:phosphotransferase [Methylococcaceae bacterium]
MTQCSIAVTSTEKTSGRCLALFPGAFRPPHLAHFQTVLSLVSRPDIDEVIIIITNRCRHVPGTSKALEPSVAIKIWSIFLQGIPKVRVELAPHSAVKHAQSYFKQVNSGDTLLFCAGENELKNGMGRFSEINTLAKKYAITASVIASSPPPLPGGATAIRTHLAKGRSGYEAFITALPNHLAPEQCEQVWQICYQNMREMRDIAKDKIREIIEQQGIGEIDNILIAKNAKPDEVHCVQLTTGQRLFVKYANDTVKAAKLGQPLSLKPRARLYVERRALKWLANHRDYGIKLPDVVYFENKSKTLMLSEVFPNGHFLEDDLKKGTFDSLVLTKVSSFLANCHRTLIQIEPFWGNPEAELQHWENLLSLRTVGLQHVNLSEQVKDDLAKLKCASAKVTQLGFFHLDFCPKNIRLFDNEIGIIDFELSSSIGDPAYDFGFLLGHILFWGIITSSHFDSQQALQSAVSIYRKVIGHSWLVIYPRIVAFSGAAILYCLNNNKQSRQKETQLLNIAAVLLEQKMDSLEDIFHIFYRVINHEFD